MNRKLARTIPALLSAAMLLLTMTACAASPGSGQSGAGTEQSAGGAPEAGDPDGQPQASEAYAALVQRFYALVSDPFGVEELAEYGEDGVAEAARAMADSAPEAIGYAIEDISGDGVPELVVGTLPEHGGLVNVVYTLVDGTPQLVFEGCYRSSYTYLGDGRFFYYGSASAAETGQGVYALTRDGTALICEEFHFTHAADGDGSDIRVYYNTTGSWDPADSGESELSPEEFLAWDPPCEALPLIPFSSYGAAQGYDAAGAPVRAGWAESDLRGTTDCERFVADDGEYAADVLFTAARSVTDFALVKLTVDEVSDDGSVSYSAEPLYSLDVLTPERPLAVRMSFPGDIPAYGISYTDEYGDGLTHRLTVEISGEDGSLILREID